MELTTVATTPALPVSVLSLLVAAVTVVAVIIHRFLAIDYDPREPPIIKPGIPYIGHILGIIRHGAKYFDTVNRKTQYPIYTLPTLSSRQYIVTSPQIAAQLQRQHKDLAFYNVILEVTRRLLGLNSDTMRIIMTNVNREEGDWGLMPKMHDMFSDVLGRGESLKELTRLQMTLFSDMLNEIAIRGDSVEIGLFEWIKSIFAFANAKALYGPENPFAVDPSLVDAFWEFEAGMLALIIDIVPSITARKAHKARERVAQSLVDYVRQKRYHQASQVIQNRVGLNLSHGFTVAEAGRAEIILLFAIVGNAVPSTFWIVANIVSRPELMVEIRKEIELAVADNEDGTKTINVSTLETSCPLFVSTYRESLRIIGNLASLRYVLRDTVIGGQYLRKDSIVQMAGIVIHNDKRTWGEDSDRFNPRRFIKTRASATVEEEPSELDLQEPAATQLPEGVPSSAFRLFGGGSVVCPGRHFAQSEILAFVAYLLLAFDISAPDGSPITVPPPDDEKIPLSVLKPKGDVKIKLRRREGFESTKWVLKA
ncbi:putative cytochrome P450 [Cladophialophora carrionii]|uniref:Putative cytochrome P450 n=1 Tax=Cladophialophora carrionii TaxID=86049 RepID=A0A1C1CHS7_9EURO|nr:putative cytochrome P450 [Cladophialophora carrionii]